MTWLESQVPYSGVLCVTGGGPRCNMPVHVDLHEIHVIGDTKITKSRVTFRSRDLDRFSILPFLRHHSTREHYGTGHRHRQRLPRRPRSQPEGTEAGSLDRRSGQQARWRPRRHQLRGQLHPAPRLAPNWTPEDDRPARRPRVVLASRTAPESLVPGFSKRTEWSQRSERSSGRAFGLASRCSTTCSPGPCSPWETTPRWSP